MKHAASLILFTTLLATSAAAEELLRYTGNVAIDPDAGTLEATLDVHMPFVGEAPEALPFLLNGAFEIEEVSGTGVAGFETAPMGESGWQTLTVRLDEDFGEPSVALRFAYAGKPNMPANGINQISPDWVELSVDSAWHPIVAAIDRHLSVDVVFHLGRDWSVVSSGEATAFDGGFRLVNDIPHGDIALVAAPGLERIDAPGLTLYHRGVEPSVTTAVIEATTRCTWYLDTWFGAERPLPEAQFVITDREEGGYARKNFIALTRVGDRSDSILTQFLCHELSHYWSSGALPLTVDNWLNEGFAVYVAARAMRAFYGEEPWLAQLENWRERSADQPSIWTDEDRSRRPFEVNYKKAPLALHELERHVGAETFERLLRRYMTAPIDSTEALLAALEEVAGSEARAWFVERLAR